MVAQTPHQFGAAIELGEGSLYLAAAEISGYKALIQAVLELAMPYTIERDDVLHGFLYGTEGLPDLGVTRAMLSAEATRLAATPEVRPLVIEEVVWPRWSCFTNRWNECLNEIASNRQPELPRLVGHTLRLLNLLRDAWTQPANSPPPALEIGRGTNALQMVLYGEPYTRYTLQYRDNLSAPGWTTTTTTNWRNEQSITLPVSGGSQRFYRGLPPP